MVSYNLTLTSDRRDNFFCFLILIIINWFYSTLSIIKKKGVTSKLRCRWNRKSRHSRREITRLVYGWSRSAGNRLIGVIGNRRWQLTTGTDRQFTLRCYHEIMKVKCYRDDPSAACISGWAYAARPLSYSCALAVYTATAASSRRDLWPAHKVAGSPCHRNKRSKII